MTISTGQIIGLALRLVSKRDQIASIWSQIAPLVNELTSDPAVKGLLQSASAHPQAAQQQPMILPPSPDLSVTWLQQSLNALGYKLAASGQYDDATKAAVSAFQKAHPPLVVDGWAGINTQATIHDEITKHHQA